MSEVLVQFSEPVHDEKGVAYTAQACGRLGDDQLWEGWIEFIPLTHEGEALRTGRETTQPNRTDLAYWASGLTVVYLEGALRRAADPTRVIMRTTIDATPRFSQPAPPLSPPPAAETPRAVLNPIAVYAQGETVLRQELSALDGMHLRNILRAYAPHVSFTEATPEVELRERIIAIARAASVPRTTLEDRPPAP